MKQFLNRVIATIQLDPKAYIEIRENRLPISQALLLVILSSIATAIGSVGGYFEKIPMAIGISLLAWTIWMLFIYIVGVRIFSKSNTQIKLSTLISVLGFASTPGILKILAFTPAVSGITLFGATIWMLATTTLATQQALRYESFPRALGLTFTGWIIYQFVLFQI